MLDTAKMEKAYQKLNAAIEYEAKGNKKFCEMSLKLACRYELEALGFPIPKELMASARTIN